MSETLDPNGIPAVGVVDDVDQWLPILSAVEGVEAGTNIKPLAGVTSATKNLHWYKDIRIYLKIGTLAS